ncbi:sodium:solute symporter family transporter [Pontiella sulfatireligans]|uniref:Sodium/glucose cotransporter n=1 Tax=Pontiella sulfatireligans TaxID=2750658 RepID=A0A6C2UG36_9BACT|nr:Na+:solute symporter [Pontiella sulfatireligans]VGO18487.1 Sodium/glucose cotransporter [Pontiella sulfatireligans]
MQTADYIVIVLYIIGIVGAGMVFAGKMKSSKDMFAAGGQSPWWVSGLSGFMTMFSAGTFVVWGGIAYKYGFVAVVINMCYGVSAMLVGWFLAGYWRKLGVNSAAEFLQLRFGGSIVQFYTWFQGTVGIFAVGGAIYALSKIVCALMPLPVGHLLADPNTGMLSVPFVSVMLCVMVILITFSGGLWAVLMTDVLQFVILVVSVIFVVPLILMKAGGWSSFIEKAPEGFTSPVAADFTWWFMAGWVIIHFFKIGGEWGFVQRYTCVPTAKDAKKAAFIFGAMYLISPLFWMLPPLVFRVLNPNVDVEQAYILSCKLVLPAGMMGLMIAAMASATASAATSQLNVFAGAFTTEVYQRLLKPGASDKQMVQAGRVFTIVLGGVVIAGALLIPRYGYTRFILDLTTLLTGPLVLPTIWGLFSKKIGIKAVWGTTLVGFAAAAIVKFGLTDGGFLAGVGFLEPLSEWVVSHMRIADLTSGILVPFIVLVILELTEKHEHPGWQRVMNSKQAFHETEAVQTSTMPAVMVAITLAVIGVMMTILALINRAEMKVLLSFALTLYAIVAVVFFAIRKAGKN